MVETLNLPIQGLVWSVLDDFLLDGELCALSDRGLRFGVGGQGIPQNPKKLGENIFFGEKSFFWKKHSSNTKLSYYNYQRQLYWEITFE